MTGEPIYRQPCRDLAAHRDALPASADLPRAQWDRPAAQGGRFCGLPVESPSLLPRLPGLGVPMPRLPVMYRVVLPIKTECTRNRLTPESWEYPPGSL